MDNKTIDQLKFILSKSEEDFQEGRVFSHDEVENLARNYKYGSRLVSHSIGQFV